ncbi:hypothetical protein [Paenibacillus chungangensis]|uniref:Uncharacterized protein n=1 Tax=Paenibacillus chungangensis TaxID=696535 RepID=A0ABW3HXP3_9BACL
MDQIADAKVRRLADKQGIPCVEVEAHTSGGAELLAYIALNGATKGYRLLEVVHNDAHYETDWFDNNLHQAKREFAGTDTDERSVLQAVLAVEGVSAGIDRLLSESNR